MKKQKFWLAAALACAIFAVPAFAEDDDFDFAPDGEQAKSAGTEKSAVSVSLEGAYAKSLKKPARGGVDMAGFDLRLNFDVNERNQFSLGMLVLGGSENVGGNTDLDTTNVAVFAGYRAVFPIVKNRVNAYLGARVGLVYASAELDEGRFDGWDNYRSDDDTCAAYAVEVGLSYAFTEKWSVRGGYEYYGNTTRIGGGDTKFYDQQYHVFQLGAEYRF